MVNAETVFSAISNVSLAISNLNAFPFTPGFDVVNVLQTTYRLPQYSWEFGTFTETLLELHNPEVSVFGSNPFPVPSLNPSSVPALTYLVPKVRFGTGYSALDEGNEQAGDPASMGVGAVLLGKTNAAFARAANQTVNGLLHDAPRFWNGAISHRGTIAELWADFMYMAPPFLAYYAADTRDESLLKETVRQCSLYRQILRPNITDPWKGVWHHIAGPQNQDLGYWSTGNAWAAAGLSRVLATVAKSTWLQDHGWKQSATDSLTQYIKEIIDGAMNSPKDRGLLRNYLNDRNSQGHGFGEISGSALLAATVYRMAVLQPSIFQSSYIGWADDIRKVISGRDSRNNPHVTSWGGVVPAVNPYAWLDTRPYLSGSPEGNSFVILMFSAWRDCVKAGKCEFPRSSPQSRVKYDAKLIPRCYLRSSRHRRSH